MLYIPTGTLFVVPGSLEVLVSDVLPLLSSVVGVPEGSGGEVEAHGEGEGGNKGGSDEDRVSSEEGVVDDVLESGHSKPRNRTL